MTPSQVAEGLSERDLSMMMQYAARHMLPNRRLQKQLALLAHVHVGGQSKLDDFMLRHRPEDAPPADTPKSEAEHAAAFLSGLTGGAVRVLGRKRRAREALH